MLAFSACRNQGVQSHMRSLLLVAAVTAAAGLSFAASAATQGTPGATSSGSVNITLTIPHLVRITGLDDLALVHSATGDITGSELFCVNDNLNATDRGYYITATSQNGSGTDFRLLTTGPAYLVYDVNFDDDTDASDGVNLNNGTQSTTEFDSGSATNMGASCSSPNASIRVTITEAAHQAAQAGSYSDVLTLLVTAD